MKTPLLGHLEYKHSYREVKGKYILKRKGEQVNPKYIYFACDDHHRSVAEGPSLGINKW